MRVLLLATAIVAAITSSGCPPSPDPDDNLYIFVRVDRELPASGECRLSDLENTPPVTVAFTHQNSNILLEDCQPHAPKATGQVNEDNDAEFTLNLEGPELVYTDLGNGFCATSFGAFCITGLGPPTHYTVRITDSPTGVWNVTCNEADDDFDAAGNTLTAEVTYNVNDSCAASG